MTLVAPTTFNSVFSSVYVFTAIIAFMHIVLVRFTCLHSVLESLLAKANLTQPCGLLLQNLQYLVEIGF